MMREKLSTKLVKLQIIILLFLMPGVSFLSACTVPLQLPVQAIPGYQLSLFTSGNTSYQSPDGIATDQGHIFIGYQNNANKEGTDHKTSTIVEYSMSGQLLKTFSVSGHTDGLRINTTTHLLWALSNENANPVLTIINTTNRHSTEYTFPPTAHQGGYDDLYFLKGMQYPFISASNPTLKAGQNNFPSVYQITQLEDGNPGRVAMTPILDSHALAVDRVTQARVTLNEIDPDSLSTDSQGNLVLMNEDGNEVVFVSHPGTAQQEVSRLAVGTQLDDTLWIPSPARGRLLIVDGIRNQTYWMEAAFKSDTVYTETTSTQSVVEQLDPHTGILTTIATGFLKPTGLLFVPD